MDRCHDDRELWQLDPVTFFVITELMEAEREQLSARLQPQTSRVIEDIVHKAA